MFYCFQFTLYNQCLHWCVCKNVRAMFSYLPRNTKSFNINDISAMCKLSNNMYKFIVLVNIKLSVQRK